MAGGSKAGRSAMCGTLDVARSHRTAYPSADGAFGASKASGNAEWNVMEGEFGVGMNLQERGHRWEEPIQVRRVFVTPGSVVSFETARLVSVERLAALASDLRRRDPLRPRPDACRWMGVPVVAVLVSLASSVATAAASFFYARIKELDERVSLIASQERLLQESLESARRGTVWSELLIPVVDRFGPHVKAASTGLLLASSAVVLATACFVIELRAFRCARQQDEAKGNVQRARASIEDVTAALKAAGVLPGTTATRREDASPICEYCGQAIK